MNRVATGLRTQRNSKTSLISRVQRKFSASWHRCHIGHRSEYSVERLLAFRDYYQRTSFSRAIGVCALTPVPALLIALAIDCIPVKSPSEGWKANYAVWIRLLLAIIFASLGVVLEVKEAIEEGAISNRSAVKIAVSTATCSVSTMMLMAALWKFPSPFGYVLVIGPYVAFLSIFTTLGIGQDLLMRSPVLRAQLKTQFVIIVNQGLVVGCYALFSAVFNRLSGVQQSAFVFVMPLIKFFTKQNVANAAESYGEYVGPVVVFSVDLFNMYYATICMQMAKSAITTAIIMAADIFHLVLALRTILNGANAHKTKGRVQDMENYLDELPQMLQKLSKEKKMKPSLSREKALRLVAPFPLPLSDESKIFLAELLKMNNNADVHRWTSKKCIKEGKQARNANSIPTHAMIKQTQIFPVNSIVSKPRKVKNATEETIQDALQKLFHSEYVLLSEYIEFVIPMLYAPYLAVLYHLPVAAYYPHTASMSSVQMTSAVRNILLYGMIEFIAFAILLAILRRRFGFSPLHQLAFVLETHTSALQGHLFVWTITILHLTLAHYGVDFNILTSL